MLGCGTVSAVAGGLNALLYCNRRGKRVVKLDRRMSYSRLVARLGESVARQSSHLEASFTHQLLASDSRPCSPSQSELSALAAV